MLMKRKTLYIILASVWAVALITLITVCVTAFGNNDKNGNSVTPSTGQHENIGGGSNDDDEEGNWSNPY